MGSTMNVFGIGDCVDFANDPAFPCRAWMFGKSIFSHRDEGTYYGFCTDHSQLRTRRHGTINLAPGTFFCTPREIAIKGAGFVVERIGRIAMFHMGGPVEHRGRLKYIDGCSDTVLIHPWKLGEPCLNHLHFPPEIRQTMHTHPSVRIGVVFRGEGECVTPSANTRLQPGYGWFLPVDDPHCFYTNESTMDVIAWHPDSDTGPTDEDHPMINRTIVDGVSASKIDAIKTQEIVG